MSSIISDPDNKINMSLDEIIRLTRAEIRNNLRWNKKKKKRRKLLKNDSVHSVPLLMSSEGVSVYVTNKSPLLNPDIKQSFINSVTNRALNAELLKNSTRIIPAKYKLIKTSNGVERILVPVKNYICKPLRKLHEKNNFDCCKKVADDIPQLMSKPLLKPVQSPLNVSNQNVVELDKVDSGGCGDDDDDDVIVLDFIKKKPQLIHVEMNKPVAVSNFKQPQTGTLKTLHDRFTGLTGNFQF